MTKEELEKEAEDYANKKVPKAEMPNMWSRFYKSYLASAEPREKRIEELEDKLANADYQLEGRDNEIRELKEQIKEMKGILLCTCEGCSRLPKLYKAFDKEVKEK